VAPAWMLEPSRPSMAMPRQACLVEEDNLYWVPAFAGTTILQAAPIPTFPACVGRDGPRVE
ncbi:MAG: hypothetical protein U1F34_09695, partial [Gammaproteobacteria bacterium]